MKVKKYGKFLFQGESDTKKQIILTHTSRNLSDYHKSLEHRFNGKYDKIPNYTISDSGVINQLIDPLKYSKYMTEESVNKNSIIICLENLGWLNKEPLKDFYVNWIGDIYNGKVVDRKWRDYFFWHPYTDVQIHSTVFLCKKLMKNLKIKNQVIEHNTKINGIEKFEGVVTKSNYEMEYTDLSPAFDFENFINLMKNE